MTHNNIYVHSSPPKAISGSGAAIRQWVKSGDMEKLEKLVLEGQGARLLGLVELAHDPKIKAFLRSIPGYMAKVELIHDAVIRGSLRETQALIDKKKMATARDAVGRGIGHKAVIYNNKSILEWVAKKHHDTLNAKDNEGRTSLHYAAASRDPTEMYELLLNLGSNPDIIDMHGHKANYYINHPDELDIEGPTTTRSLSRGKRRRISPISPPKRKMIGLVSPPTITRAQIRIWIHEKDIPKLENIVWSGHGDKLLLETTNNGKVRRFLENVPHLLSRIKSIHGAAINNDLEGLKEMRAKTEMNEIFKAKDLHGLTPLHKAAGIGHRGIVEYLLHEIPDALTEVDDEGRTPLHYAARDPNVYSYLVVNGADENVHDQKGKTPAYYRSHLLELDTRHLRNVPDAPRVTGELSGWDRASPTLTLGKRRTSSGEFSNHNQATTGKYELNNVEISEGDLRVDEIDFAPVPPKSVSRNQSRDDISMETSSFGSNASSRTSETRIASPTSSKTGAEKHESRPPSGAPLGTEQQESQVPTEPVSGTEDKEPESCKDSEAASETKAEKPKSRPQSKTVLGTEGENSKSRPASRIASEPETESSKSRVPSGKTSETQVEKPESEVSSAAVSATETNKSESQDSSAVPSGTETEKPKSRSSSGTALGSGAENSEPPAPPEVASEVGAEKPESRPQSRAASHTKNSKTVSRENSKNELDVKAVKRRDTFVQEAPEEKMAVDDDFFESPSEAANNLDQPSQVQNMESETIEAQGSPEESSNKPDQSNVSERPVSVNKAVDVGESVPPAEAQVQENSNSKPLEKEASASVKEAPTPQEPQMDNANTVVEEKINETVTSDEKVPALATQQNEKNANFEEALMEEIRNPVPEAEEVETEAIKEEQSVENLKGPPATSSNEVESKDDAGSEAAKKEELDEVDEALKRGDMEALVNKILDGKGLELLNKKTDNPDVQEFLSNVPAYMAKIASIHHAATNGNLRDLQSLVDRKRLVLARDAVGRGPLHMAVLNNHSTVARYLASTYPNSLKLLDNKGRSALHFAATLSDSGSLYKYLVNLGADPNIKDVEGNTPGIYLRNRDLLSHKELVEESPVGIGETASPVQRWERPKTPAVSTITTLDNFYNTTLMKKESLWTKAWRRLTHQSDSSCKELVRKYLDRTTFNLIKFRGMRDGSSLLDVVKFYPQFFIIAPGEEAYDVYQELFLPAIMDHNRVPADFEGKTSLLGAPLPEIEIPQVDVPSKFLTQARMRVSRNIRPFPFVPQMKKGDLIHVSNLLKTVQLNWPCFNVEGLEKEVLEELKQKCWMPEATKISRLWPKQRHFSLSHDGNVQVWMNAEDHLDIIVTSKYGRLYQILESLNNVYMTFSQSFSFYENDQFGFLTVDPFRVGTGIKITFRIRLPTLMKEKNKLTEFCSLHNLSIRWKNNRIENEIEPDDWIELENNQTLGKTEIELAVEFASTVNKLIKIEEEQARILILTEKENKKLELKRARFPTVWSEEGKYLASVLGDALVKGLTEVSQERPEDPVEYLANFLRKYHDGGKEGETTEGVPNETSPMETTTEASTELQAIDESPMTAPVEESQTDPTVVEMDELPPAQDSSGRESDDSEEMIRRLDDEVDDTIEVVDKEEQEEEDRQLREQQQMRDDKGQSVLHFAASRPGGGQTIISFLQNPSVNLAWRDENLKTARDVAADLGRTENVMSIDSYVISLATQGQLESLQKLMLDGYDHLTETMDTSKTNILQLSTIQEPVLGFLQSVDVFRDKVERLHRSIRLGHFEKVKDYVQADPRLAIALNQYGRSSLHIAVLMEEHSIAQLLANEFPEVLKRGDHLERMPLHYAMGVEKVEKMTRILVRAGARRVVKDLRGRQPSYYFINREEIALLQEQEEQLKESS